MISNSLIKTYSGEIATERILSFRNADKFIALCRECVNYGKNYACPPVSCDIEKLLGAYSLATVYVHVFDIDYNNGDEYRAAREYCDTHILQLEKATEKSLGFIAGFCMQCNSCERERGLPCCHKSEQRLSLDSLSLDVTALLSELFDYTLDWSGKTLSLTTLLLH